MEDWIFYDIGFENQTKKINGKNIWRHAWEPLKVESFEAPHPYHENQTYLFKVYRFNFKGGNIVFAAAEISNLVWCIYVPA